MAPLCHRNGDVFYQYPSKTMLIRLWLTLIILPMTCLGSELAAPGSHPETCEFSPVANCYELEQVHTHCVCEDSEIMNIPGDIEGHVDDFQYAEPGFFECVTGVGKTEQICHGTTLGHPVQVDEYGKNLLIEEQKAMQHASEILKTSPPKKGNDIDDKEKLEHTASTSSSSSNQPGYLDETSIPILIAAAGLVLMGIVTGITAYSGQRERRIHQSHSSSNNEAVQVEMGSFDLGN